MFQNTLDWLEALPDWQKYGAVVGFCVLLFVGYYFFSYSENAIQIEQLNETIVKLDSKIKAGMAMKDKERELEREVALLDEQLDRKSTRLNSSHTDISRMPSSA